MSLATLPKIEFCNTDAANVEESVITVYESLTDLKLYPGDPVRLFLESLACVIVQQRVIIDSTAKQNLLFFASKEKLDHLGALTGTERLKPSKASAVFKFFIQTPVAYNVLIPAGTRITLDQKLFYKTMESGQIPAGETEVEIIAECTTQGTAGNDFLPGQVSFLVDMIEGVEISAVNITKTSGGTDVEDDDRFKERIHLSPAKYSTAGPGTAYKYWAKTAHQDICDVAVHSSSGSGLVEVFPLLKGGVIPGQALLDLVQKSLDPESIVPLTDDCQVKPPEPLHYSIDIEWYLAKENSAMAGTVQTAVMDAIEKYTEWQCSVLGRDINPTELIFRMKTAGVVRVEVLKPVHTKLLLWQVAQIQDINVVYGGFE